MYVCVYKCVFLVKRHHIGSSFVVGGLIFADCVRVCVFLYVYQFRAVRFWSGRMCACGLQCVSPKFSSGTELPRSLAVSQRRLFPHLSWGSRPSFHSEIYAKTIIPNCRITLLQHSSKAHYNLCWFTKPRFLTDWKRETERLSRYGRVICLAHFHERRISLLLMLMLLGLGFFQNLFSKSIKCWHPGHLCYTDINDTLNCEDCWGVLIDSFSGNNVNKRYSMW